MPVEGLPFTGQAPPPSAPSGPPAAAPATPFGALLAAASQQTAQPAALDEGAVATPHETTPQGAAAEGTPRGAGPDATTPKTPAASVAAPRGLVEVVPLTPAADAAAGSIDVTRPDRPAEAAHPPAEEPRPDEASSEALLATLAASLGLAASTTPAASPGPVEVAGQPPQTAPVAAVAVETVVDVAAGTPPATPTTSAPAVATETPPVEGAADPVPPASNEAGQTEDAPAAAQDGAEHARPAERRGAAAPESSERPEERLGVLLREVDPHERAEIASAWNRAGGRFEDDAAPTGGPPAGSNDQPPGAEPASAGGGSPAAPAVDVTQATTAAADADASTVGAQVEAVGRARERQPEAPAHERASRETTATPADASTPYAVDVARTARADVAPPAAAPAPQAGVLDTADAEAMTARLADTVRSAVRTGDDGMRLVLNPPELGHLDVEVARGDGGLRVTVAASTPDAADLIRQHLPSLVSALEARDLRVDRAEVRHADAAAMPQAGGQQAGQNAGGGNPGWYGRSPDETSEEWARPAWSPVAALERASARAEARRAERATTRLLDLVA